MDFLFLPPVYIITLLLSAVIVGIVFEEISQKGFLLRSGILFTVFASSQIIFRYLLHEQPERLFGQLIYFVIFLLVVHITHTIKLRII